MTSELVLWFGSIERSDRKAIEKMLRMVPSLSADLLESCDVGLWLRSPSLRVRLHLRNAAGTPTVILRISAWAARARGVALAPATAAARADQALESADLSDLGVAPPELPRILDRAFSALAKTMGARSLAPENEALRGALALAGAGEAAVAIRTTNARGPLGRALLLERDVERSLESTRALRDAAIDVVVASSHADPIWAGELAPIDVVILSADVPAEAERVLRAIRAADPRPLPIIVSSAASPSYDPGLLRAGADVVLATTAAPYQLVLATLDLLEEAAQRVAPGAAHRPISCEPPTEAGGVREWA